MRTGAYDTVIIGGGMAGLLAAISLTRNGRRVALISKGDPVCRLSTGCIDILNGDASLSERLASLPDKHPYHRVGIEGIRRAGELFLSVMKEQGLNYAGDILENRHILSPSGALRQTALVPESMVHGEVDETDCLHLITFKGIKDFFPGYVTSRFRAASVNEFDAGEASTLGLATRFNDPGFCKAFVTWINGLNLSPGKLAMPAVLGTLPGVFGRLTEDTGQDVFEIPTLPPSIPGLRLFNALKNYFRDSGGDLYWGHGVRSVEAYNQTIEAVTLEGNNRATRVEGKTFILSTGSFISGGLYACQDGTVEERVFHLKAFAPENRDTWFGQDFFKTGHGIETSGIPVNRSFQPENTDTRNLFVCGSILAFSEIMKYGCGHGLAIATGVAAAKRCEEQLP